MLAKPLEGLHSKVDKQLNVFLLGPPTQLFKPGWMHKVVDGHAWLHLVLLLQHHQLGVRYIKDLLSS